MNRTKGILLALLLIVSLSGCYYGWYYWTGLQPPIIGVEWEPIGAEG
ncbi:MAG: hypothetical protein JXQ75_19585 [Phycisphaerae bacterium]|nr:hypothetical protein [Phycisphaerae bacterium]